MQYIQSTGLHKNKQEVNMESILRFHCNASGEGVVGKKLLHRCECGSKEAMNHNMWDFNYGLFSWLFNMDSIEGRVGTIAF